MSDQQGAHSNMLHDSEVGSILTLQNGSINKESIHHSKMEGWAREWLDHISISPPIAKIRSRNPILIIFSAIKINQIRFLPWSTTPFNSSILTSSALSIHQLSSLLCQRQQNYRSQFTKINLKFSTKYWTNQARAIWDLLRIWWSLRSPQNHSIANVRVRNLPEMFSGTQILQKADL